MNHQPTRIALLIPTIDQIGGAERQVLLLAQSLKQRGWQVTVITLSGHGGQTASGLQDQGIPYLSLHMRKAWFDPRGWLRYLQWRRQNRPEILHTHLPHATWFARSIRLFAPIRVQIDTLHTSHTGSAARKRTYRWTHWLTNQVTCVSHAVALSALAAKIVQRKNLTILPNGIPIPSPTSPRPTSDNFDQTFQWIAVGRLAPVKDYPTLLTAFAQLPSHARLTVIGTGPEEPTLRQQAKDLGVIDRVHFAGFQPDVPACLTQADAFIQTSLWEGLPVSILEASAASLPIVATDAAGTREALHPSTPLVSTGNVAAVTQAMLNLMAQSKAARQTAGRQNRKFVEDNYGLPAITQQWEALYIELLNRNP